MHTSSHTHAHMLIDLNINIYIYIIAHMHGTLTSTASLLGFSTIEGGHILLDLHDLSSRFLS